MPEEIIKSFIVHGCYGDTLRYQEYVSSKSKSVKEEQIKGQWSYITELMVITIKSLVPSREQVGTVMDYKRLQKELELWDQYRHGSNNLVLSSLRNSVSDSYWTESDESIYARIFPIVAANTKWEIIKDEVIKNVLYTTGSISDIIEAIASSRLLFSIMNGMKDYDDIVSDIKEEIIHFAQQEFLDRYSGKHLLNLDTYPGNYTIAFERKKITLLNVLNEIFINNEFKVLRNSLKLLTSQVDDIDTCSFWLMGIRGIRQGAEIDDLDFKDRKFIESLGGYLFKLRKGRINPETLEIDNYELPDIFRFSLGDDFNHTLLNRCKVIKREEKSNFTVSYIQTKTGVYRFFKRIN